MKKKEYLIGDVAAMIGVSRDTLRFYEKKGIISVRKKENGYRYYSEDDIFTLSSIFYHRKMNIGLDEIESLWTDDSSFETSAKITKQQIEAEKEEILKHQQALVRLHLMQEECQKIEQNLNQVSTRNFPRAYLIKTCDSPQDSVIAWFCESQKEPGLDMLYTYDTYRSVKKEGTAELEFQHSSLLLYEELTGSLTSSFDLNRYQKTGTPECLYTIIESESRVPDREVIDRMISWGKEHNKIAGDLVISDYIMHGMQDGTFIFYLEIYIPVIQSH